MDLVSILPLVLLAVVFYLLIMRPARNRQKQQQQLIASVGPGTKIMTTAGFYGTISAREGDDLSVVLAPGVEIRMIAAAVARTESGLRWTDAAEFTRTWQIEPRSR